MSEKVDKPVNWHQIDPTEVLEKLQSSDMGLVSEEARRRFEHYGPNELIEKKHKSLWMMFFDQFKDFMILVLIAAAAGPRGTGKCACLCGSRPNAQKPPQNMWMRIMAVRTAAQEKGMLIFINLPRSIL
jgi:magnesium-transporting ATPase (P-type)